MLFLSEGRRVFEGSPEDGLNHPQVQQILGSYNEIISLIRKKV
jgi:hypothetical protein